MKDEKYSVDKISIILEKVIKEFNQLLYNISDDNNNENDVHKHTKQDLLDLISEIHLEKLVSFIYNKQKLVSILTEKDRRLFPIKFYDQSETIITEKIKNNYPNILVPYLFKEELYEKIIEGNFINKEKEDKVFSFISQINELSKLSLKYKLSDKNNYSEAYKKYKEKLDSLLTELLILINKKILNQDNFVLYSDEKNQSSILHLCVKLPDTILSSILLKMIPSIKNYFNTESKTCDNDKEKNIDININMNKDYISYVDIRDIYLRTPLHYTVQLGNFNQFKMLVEDYNANCFCQDSVGRTIAHYAFSGNNIDIVKYILSRLKELVLIQDNYLRTPFHYLVYNKNINRQFISNEIADSLLSFYVLAENSKSDSKQNTDISKFIQDFNIDIFDENGKTPLHYASELGEEWILYDLISLGANPTIYDLMNNKSSILLAKEEKIKNMMLVAYTSKDLAKKFIPKNKLKELIMNNKCTSSNNFDTLDQSIYNKAKNDVYKKLYEKERLEKIRIEEQYKEILFGISNLNKNINFDNKGNVIDNNRKKEAYFDKALYNAFNKEKKEKVSELMDIYQTKKLIENQHLKDPKAFSGSWLEDVHTPEDLMKMLGNMPASEAVIRVYNVLNPMNFSKLEKTRSHLEDKIDNLLKRGENNNSYNHNNYNYNNRKMIDGNLNNNSRMNNNSENVVNSNINNRNIPGNLNNENMIHQEPHYVIGNTIYKANISNNNNMINKESQYNQNDNLNNHNLMSFSFKK